MCNRWANSYHAWQAPQLKSTGVLISPYLDQEGNKLHSPHFMELGDSIPHSQQSTTCPYPSQINPFLCLSHFWQAQLVSFLVGLRIYQHHGTVHHWVNSWLPNHQFNQAFGTVLSCYKLDLSSCQGHLKCHYKWIGEINYRHKWYRSSLTTMSNEEVGQFLSRSGR